MDKEIGELVKRFEPEWDALVEKCKNWRYDFKESREIHRTLDGADLSDLIFICSGNRGSKYESPVREIFLLELSRRFEFCEVSPSEAEEISELFGWEFDIIKETEG